MRWQRQLQSPAVALSRTVLGSLLAISGFVKAVDPLGTAYKIQDYFAVAGLEQLNHFALPLAILLNTSEFVIGCAILFGWVRRISSALGLGMMIFFTPLTLYIAIANPVPHCGCFGDAWIISNWQTFFKNLGLLAAAIVVYRNARQRPVAKPRRRAVFGLGSSTVFILGLSVYALLYLPVIDFRPWRIGNHIPTLVETGTPPVVQHSFTYQHKETGETKAITEKELASEGVPDPDYWRFVDRRTDVVAPGIPAQIENFSIHDEWGEDYTTFYIADHDVLLIVVIDDLQATRASVVVEEVEPLAASAAENGISLIALTSSPFEEIHAFATEHLLTFPFYQTDERALKTMIRSNPGLILLQQGTVKGKWPHRRMPSTWDEMAP